MIELYRLSENKIKTAIKKYKLVSLTSRSMISLGLGALGRSTTSGILTLSFLTSDSMNRNFLSNSSHLLTSLTNFLWNTLTSLFNWKENRNPYFSLFFIFKLLYNLHLETARIQLHRFPIWQNTQPLVGWIAGPEPFSHCGTLPPFRRIKWGNLKIK